MPLPFCHLVEGLRPAEVWGLVRRSRLTPFSSPPRVHICIIYPRQDDFKREVDYIEEVFTPLVEKCKSLNRAMRIGTNHGACLPACSHILSRSLNRPSLPLALAPIQPPLTPTPPFPKQPTSKPTF